MTSGILSTAGTPGEQLFMSARAIGGNGSNAASAAAEVPGDPRRERAADILCAWISGCSERIKLPYPVDLRRSLAVSLKAYKSTIEGVVGKTYVSDGTEADISQLLLNLLLRRQLEEDGVDITNPDSIAELRKQANVGVNVLPDLHKLPDSVESLKLTPQEPVSVALFRLVVADFCSTEHPHTVIVVPGSGAQPQIANVRLGKLLSGVATEADYGTQAPWALPLLRTHSG